LILNGSNISVILAREDLRAYFLSFQPEKLLEPVWNNASSIMDFWNLMSIIRMNVEFNIPDMQILATHIVPTYLTANFRAAGLSTIPVELLGYIKLNSGSWEMDITSHIRGLLEVEAGFAGRPMLFGRNDLRAADEGNLDARSIRPDLRIFDLSMRLQEAGFELRFTELLGLPPGSWFAIFAQQQDIQFTESFNRQFLAYSRIASDFFRVLSRSSSISVSAKPEDPPRLSEVLGSLSSGPDTPQRLLEMEYR
jgi:hypothetical protein